MTSNLKDLNWRRTSRNTEIATGTFEAHGEVLFKRGVLIDSSDLHLHVAAFEQLQDITAQIEGAISPSVIKELCDTNIIALQRFSSDSFHDVWCDENYPSECVIQDIAVLYDWLDKFHLTTAKVTGGLPYSYGDFGPKNLLRCDQTNVAFIDPPISFIERESCYDIGTLVFEIDRSLVQANRPWLIFRHRHILKRWVGLKPRNCSFKSCQHGVRSHVLAVAIRYATFFKKPNPFFQFLRALFFIPCLLAYQLIMSVHDAINYQRKN